MILLAWQIFPFTQEESKLGFIRGRWFELGKPPHSVKTSKLAFNVGRCSLSLSPTQSRLQTCCCCIEEVYFVTSVSTLRRA